MSVFNTLIWRASRFLKAFQAAYVSTDILDNETFEDYNSRLIRYSIYFAFYENTVYDAIHSWSGTFKTRYALYNYIRTLYNPAYRLTEFWRTVLWGGILDLEGGESGAIPIQTDSAALRKAIAQLWKQSDFDVTKDIITLNTCAMGDGAIKVIDNPEKGKVYLECIHPTLIRDIALDFRGNVQGYVLEDQRTYEGREATFVEVCEKSGENIIYSTYKDGKPFAWNGTAARWSIPYGFVPFVVFRHNNVGQKWGWAEMHPVASKIREVDDASSKIHDYLRKAVDPVWLFNFRKPRAGPNIRAEGAAATDSIPQPGREELNALYIADARASAKPLVTDLLNIEHATGTVQDLIAELERELPELQMDIWTAGGYTTGKALRTARQRVEKKVILRRPNYDKPLVRAQQMCVAIAGERGYEGFDTFNLGSFERGELDHEVRAERPIFDTDELEAVERKQVFWRTIIEAVRSNVPIEPILEDHGWSDTRIANFMSKLPKPEDEVPEENNSGGEQDVPQEDARALVGQRR